MRERIAQLLLLYSFSGNPTEFERFVTVDYDRALINVQMQSLSTARINDLVGDLETYLETEKPDLNAVPTGFAIFSRVVNPKATLTAILT